MVEVMSHNLGTRVLGEIPVTLSAPTVQPVQGPSMSGDTVYTDHKTILSVQKKLAERGYFTGVVDGKWDDRTEVALSNFTGKHGPPDKAMLASLGLLPHGEPLLPPFVQNALDKVDAAIKQNATKSEVQTAASNLGNASPEVKAEAAKIQQAAANAKNAEELNAAKKELAALKNKVEGKSSGNFLTREVPNLGGMKGWQLGLVCIGTLAVGFGTYKIVTSTGRTSR